MRPISRTHLARIAAVEIVNAACKPLTVWWADQEGALASCHTAKTRSGAAAAALCVCAQCPAETRQACADLAHLDRYTGIAGGSIYLNGQPQNPFTESCRSGRSASISA